jgi:aerobic-type carbon monoxide dehydrogenase small subunit (CoxS/CutS family)
MDRIVYDLSRRRAREKDLGGRRRRALAEYELNVNSVRCGVSVHPETPLLWVLRDHVGLTGTKYSCGRGLCGACTVLVGDSARRSCVIPVSAVGERPVLTIEGLSTDGNHPIQRAWVKEGAPQCGYCHPGQIMNLVALLRRTPDPDDLQVDQALSRVLCRCGTYLAIRRAVQLVLKEG